MYNDLISRQQAIDALVKAIREDPYYDSNEAINGLGVCDVRVILNDLPPAQPEQKWIPCSERLPEEEIEVLVTRKFLGCKDGSHGWNNHIPPSTYVEVAQYFCGEWEALSDEYKIARNRHTNPIAWMPLPEPYRKEGT